MAAVRVPPSAATLLAEADGFNVHAGASGCLCVHARARATLECVCKYILRPPLARDRLTFGGDGRVFWELKRPYDDGTTHLAFEPLVLLERLAALVPPPRSHTVLYHGVLSSNAAWRPEVLPEPTEPEAAAVSAAQASPALSQSPVPRSPAPAPADQIGRAHV